MIHEWQERIRRRSWNILIAWSDLGKQQTTLGVPAKFRTHLRSVTASVNLVDDWPIAAQFFENLYTHLSGVNAMTLALANPSILILHLHGKPNLKLSLQNDKHRNCQMLPCSNQNWCYKLLQPSDFYTSAVCSSQGDCLCTIRPTYWAFMLNIKLLSRRLRP